MADIALIAVSFYLLQWASFFGGFSYIRTGERRLEKTLWNLRIDAFQKPPFRLFLAAYAQGAYLKTAGMVILLNLGMLILQGLAGLILLSPVIALIQGFMMGSLVAQGDGRTRLFSLFVCIFEIGAFSTAGAISFYLGVSWIVYGAFPEALEFVISSRLYLLPLCSLVLNGLSEASGIFFRITGVPGKRSVEEKLYK